MLSCVEKKNVYRFHGEKRKFIIPHHAFLLLPEPICVCLCTPTHIVNKDGVLFYNSAVIESYCILNKKAGRSSAEKPLTFNWEALETIRVTHGRCWIIKRKLQIIHARSLQPLPDLRGVWKNDVVWWTCCFPCWQITEYDVSIIILKYFSTTTQNHGKVTEMRFTTEYQNSSSLCRDYDWLYLEKTNI